MIGQTFFIFVVSLAAIVVANNINFGSAINCIISDNFESCRARGLHFDENVLFQKRCPGCVKRREENDPCDENNLCAPGLNCEEEKCIYDTSKPCFKIRNEGNVSFWLPECLPDGTYAPKQCKGEASNAGRCFCTNPEGNRIFGEEIWSKAENMTCACSVMMWNELNGLNRQDASLHCDDLGNFEELQCDRGICWCAHPFTGRPFSIMVPQTMFKSLPCYMRNKHGDQYLRKCDSERVAKSNAQNILAIHGTTTLTFPLVNCNYDGSYARVQTVNNKQRCVDKNNIVIKDYEIVDDPTMNCNCEYDKFVYGGHYSAFSCSPNGNYNTKQTGSGSTYCVDTDGYPKADCTPSKSKRRKNN